MANLQLNQNDFVNINNCGNCRQACRDPLFLPCQHCFCRHCVDTVVLRQPALTCSECPICIKQFSREDLISTLKLLGDDGSVTGRCVECEQQNQSLVNCNFFEGLVCQDCAATASEIEAMNLLDGGEGDLGLCLAVNCVGPPACAKKHLDTLFN